MKILRRVAQSLQCLDYELHQRVVHSYEAQKDYPFHLNFRPSPGPTQPPIQ